MFKIACTKKSTNLINYFYNKLKLKYTTKLDKIMFIDMLKKHNLDKLKQEVLHEVIEQEINEIVEISDEKKDSLKLLIRYIS